MPTLSRELRKKLEKVSAEARRIAEEAAEKALHTLAVGEREAHRTMTRPQEALRTRLRAHGRQLGDKRNIEKGSQELHRLIAECAYEHWHRMLFARSLASNNVLIEPASGEAITLDEVRELAHSRGRDWVALAGEFAVKMLPQVFRQDDPVLEVQFAPEDRKALEDLLQSLPEEAFLARDSLGWCYQFWQAERKDEVNNSGVKIGADELPAVTQLFTEDYMVDFLLDNTLGAWHASKHLTSNPELAETALSEVELRHAVALPRCPWKYLRFVRDHDGKWKPAAGEFGGWPRLAKELKCLDPCMGSGHFVVAMFERLVALRTAEEHLNEAEASISVIAQNVFGIEIDPRCTQIGAFNLALAAWRRVGHRPLPSMNLACSGQAPNAKRADWLRLTEDVPQLRFQMGALYDLFEKAPVLGSLIDPRADKAVTFGAAFDELQPLLDRALAQESTDDTAHEMAVAARGLAKAAEMLAGRYTLVATNVPFLGQKKQDTALRDYCEYAHPEAKGDLATCFLERNIGLLAQGGSTALVTPQNWLFLGAYTALRRKLLTNVCWQGVARLGPRAFETIGGEVVNAALVTLSRATPGPSHDFCAVDVSTERAPSSKALGLQRSDLARLTQEAQLRNPDCRLSLSPASGTALLATAAISMRGIVSGDGDRWFRQFWEMSQMSTRWRPLQTTVRTTLHYGGRSQIIDWSTGGQGMLRPGTDNSAYEHAGVALGQIGNLPATLYSGELYDNNTGVIVPLNKKTLLPIWAFCSSEEFAEEVRRIDQALKVTNATFLKVPFDIARWAKVASEKYPHGIPMPFSSDPTQWLFDGKPVGADEPMHVAVARLLGYQWPRQTGSSFPNCPALGPDGLGKLADDDGIVPISPAKGEGPAAERLRELLARAYGKDWNAPLQETLLAQVDYAGASLEDWLRNGFFEQHCALFHNRPFVWHLWDGLNDGFHALVNYHSLASSGAKGRHTLEKLTFSYLGDWITRQKAEQKAGREGAEAKLASALHLQNQLKLILEGEPPCDLFVRWKPLHEQAIGWQPDVNDGVRMNIRPFMMIKTLNGKSIFRKAPNIKWDKKDRGKEPERPKKEFPWFWGWDEESEDFMGGRAFDGNRWNDLHYSCEVKQAARARQKEKKR